MALCPGGCGREVDYNRLACPYHWFKIPRALRTEVWRTYYQRLANPEDIYAREMHEDAMDKAIRSLEHGTPD